MDYDVAANMDSSIIRMYLSGTKFPGFFGWVIPHSKDRAEFGVGVALPGSVKEAWKHLLKMHDIKETPKISSAVIPVEARRMTALEHGKRKVLLVGDAAGQTKATTGGGVIFGGKCAAIAGKHATAPLLYEFEWRARFGTDLLLHRIIRDYLSSLSDMQLAALGRRMKKMHFDDYLSRHGSMDKPTQMISLQTLINSLRVLIG
jgi:flavin-dependent dehydrogenase